MSERGFRRIRNYVGWKALMLSAAFVIFLALAYFPIPALVLLAGLLIATKTLWLRHVPWVHLAMVFAVTAVLTRAVHSA
jgi:hypothetical protein